MVSFIDDIDAAVIVLDVCIPKILIVWSRLVVAGVIAESSQ